MNIEIARIREGAGKIKAFVDIETEEFIMKGFRVVDNGVGGYFVGLPSREGRDGKRYAQFLPKPKLKTEIESAIMKSFNSFNPTSNKAELKDIAMKIHKSLHDGTERIMGKLVDGSFSKGKIRHIDVMGYRFITQDPTNDNEYGELARKGSKITWIMRNKEWIARCVNEEYVIL